MYLTRWLYYVDFFAYPVILLGLAGAGLATTRPGAWVAWIVAALAGLLAWTLIEYVAHRLFLHHIPVLAAMHDEHHRRPSAMIGTPIWVSGGLLGGAFLLVWPLVGLSLAGAVTAGLVAGYLWYIIVHHKSHHARPDPASYMYRAKRRHGVHHHGRSPGNFGVTTALWDHVFRTAVEADSRSRLAATVSGDGRG